MSLFQLQDPSLLRQSGFINGEWITAPSLFEVQNPATGELLARVSNYDVTHAQQAIDAATAAFHAWKNTLAKERAAVMRRWFELLMQHQKDLALIMTSEQGKPLTEAMGEVAYAASFVEWFAEEAKRVYGETIPTNDPKKRLMVIRQPIGVCAAITPWNFPLAMITRKVAPAIAAGCSVIIKPAEQTPLSALAAAELAKRAGLPQGVLNVLSADANQSIAIGKALTASAQVRHLSFTGSTEVGRILMEQSAPTIKKLSLELGGNAPLIVFNDANIDEAIEGTLASKYRNTGQTCVCANRILVQSDIYPSFMNKFVERVKALKVGVGIEPDVQQGPLIDANALKKVEQHLEDALNKGGKLMTGGKRIGDRFFEPTVVADANSSMLCAREETFGPFAPVFPFDTEAQAIQLANLSEYGLSAYFFSRDIGRVHRVAEALEVGIVGVNTGIISNEASPFGGVKQSGLGREGSRWGIEEYLEMKYICLGL